MAQPTTKQRRKTRKKSSRATDENGEPLSKKIRLDSDDIHDADESASSASRCLIITLPFELVAEILLNSRSTRDLLAISRTCRHFCATLTRPRAAYVWKNARQNMLPRPLPEPLPGWSEHGYAAFVFGSPRKCEVCNADISTPYRSYALRIMLCKKSSCLAALTNTILTEMPVSVPTSHYTTISKSLNTIESSICVELGHPLLPAVHWPNPSLVRYFRASEWAGAIQEYLEATSDPNKLAPHLMTLNERATRTTKHMEHCVEVNKWIAEFTSREKEVKSMNEKWAQSYAKLAKFDYWDLMNTSSFGTMLRGMTRTLEPMTDSAYLPVKERTRAEIKQFEDRRLRRQREATYRSAREAIAKYHHKLKGLGTHDPLPPLEAFRQLDVMKAIQSPETQDAEAQLKDRVIGDLLKMNISRWRDEVRSGIVLQILGSATTVLKPGSKPKVVHPAERISARFQCLRCKDGGDKDLCLDFAGVCSHECKTNISMPHAQRVAWRIWKISLFAKDEKAIEVLSRLTKMLEIDEQDLGAAKAWESVGARVQCKSCTGVIVMTPKDVVGHCHRHEAMDFGILTEADAASLLKDRPLVPGLAKQMLKMEQKVPEAHINKAYVCRHCPAVSAEDRHLLSVPGIRSHLSAKHAIYDVRDEDVFHVTQEEP